VVLVRCVVGEREEEGYHEERSDDPVYDYAEENLFPDFLFAEDVVESFVADFTEDGIHHY
jgi:hypothetical protein